MFQDQTVTVGGHVFYGTNKRECIHCRVSLSSVMAAFANDQKIPECESEAAVTKRHKPAVIEATLPIVEGKQ